MQKLLSTYICDLITDRGHFKDHRQHRRRFKARKELRRAKNNIPSFIKFNLSELKKASVRLKNNKFHKKKKTKKQKNSAWGSYTYCNEEVNFPYENNLPEDFKRQKSVASFAAKPWFTI